MFRQLWGDTKDRSGVGAFVSLHPDSHLSPCLQIYLRFMEYQMEHSNECKKNFVAVYDGSSAIENLKAKFCSTVANDVMLDNGVGVVRMWADEKSRLSRFRMLFTSFVDREYQSVLVLGVLPYLSKHCNCISERQNSVPASFASSNCVAVCHRLLDQSTIKTISWHWE